MTTANYAARRFGIHSALPISRAWHLAERARRSGEPATVFIQPDFQLYREVSARIMAIFERAVDVYEQASIDEAYVDLSSAGDYGASVKRLKNLSRRNPKVEAPQSVLKMRRRNLLAYGDEP